MNWHLTDFDWALGGSLCGCYKAEFSDSVWLVVVVVDKEHQVESLNESTFTSLLSVSKVTVSQLYFTAL